MKNERHFYQIQITFLSNTNDISIIHKQHFYQIHIAYCKIKNKNNIFII